MRRVAWSEKAGVCSRRSFVFGEGWVSAETPQGDRYVGFVGLGSMGGAMVEALLRGGHRVEVYDLLVSAAWPSTLLVELITIDPSTVIEVERHATRIGMTLLDAPVSGSP